MRLAAMLRILAPLSLLAALSGHAAPAWAQLSLDVFEPVDPETPRRILPPMWVYWHAPDGRVSRPCGTAPAERSCGGPSETFAAGTHRLEIVEVIGRRSHVFEIPMSGREVEARVIALNESVEARLIRRVPGLRLEPDDAGGLVLVNDSHEILDVGLIDGAAFASATYFTMRSGWQRRYVTDVHGVMSRFNLPPGGRVPARMEPRIGILPPGLHHATVSGSPERVHGGNIPAYARWQSEPYVFYGRGRAGGLLPYEL